VNEKKQFPRQQATFVVDGLATVAGSLMGTSPIATYIESAAGIREGGRTGITALTCAFYFFIALFFVPVLCESLPSIGIPALTCTS
jgi:adenine/guanine/hypoxanthine permease